MDIIKTRNKKNKLCAFAFALLMISSVALVFSSTQTTNVNAQTVGSTIPSNLIKDEWPLTSCNPQQTFLGEGPGPTSFNVAWKVTIPGIAYITKGSYNDLTLTAFNGYVFVSVPNMASAGGKYPGGVFAYDAGTGQLMWQGGGGLSGANIPAYNGVCVSLNSSTYMMEGNNCVFVQNGTTVWAAPAGFLVGGNYVADLKMFVAPYICWSLPDPSKPPTLVWNDTSQVNLGVGPFCTGQIGSNWYVFQFQQDYKLKCINALTGAIVWTDMISSVGVYQPTFANGLLFWGGLDNNLRCWNASTGQLLWTFNPHGYYGQWASVLGYQNGIVYGHNQDNYMYAVNANTGQLVWKQTGPGIAYSNRFTMVNGYVYVQMGETEYRDFASGQYGHSEFDCYNAQTGALVWTAPFEVGAGPAEQQINAYGNMYVSPTVSSNTPGVYAGSLYVGELWCISSTPQNWPQFLGSASHTTMGTGPSGLQLKWTFQTGGAVVSAASVVDGVAYFGSCDSNIYAVNANTGSKIWSFQTGFEQISTPAVANGMVYTGADDGNVYCINAATGQQVWKTPAGGITNNFLGIGESQIRASPAYFNGVVYAGSLDGNLYALNANTGAVIWKFMGVSPCVIMATPTIDNSVIYLASTTGGWKFGKGAVIGGGSTNPTSGDLYCLDLNGNTIWHDNILYDTNDTTNQGNWFFAAPTVADNLGLLFFRNGYRFTYGINATTGAILWTYKGYNQAGTPNQLGAQPQTDSVCYSPELGLCYVGNFYDVTALNATTGQDVWDLYLSREINNGGITYSYGVIYAATEAGVLYAIDAQTGAKISYYEFGTLQMHSLPVPIDGNVYIGASDWNMYCFGETRTLAPAPGSATASPLATITLAPTAMPTTPSVLPSQVPPPTSGPSSTMYVVVAAVIIIAVVAIAVLVLRRRK